MNMVLPPGEAIVGRWGQLKSPEVPYGDLHDARVQGHDLQRPVGVSPGPGEPSVTAASDHGVL